MLNDQIRYLLSTPSDLLLVIWRLIYPNHELLFHFNRSSNEIICKRSRHQSGDGLISSFDGWQKQTGKYSWQEDDEDRNCSVVLVMIQCTEEKERERERLRREARHRRTERQTERLFFFFSFDWPSTSSSSSSSLSGSCSRATASATASATAVVGALCTLPRPPKRVDLIKRKRFN